MIQHDDEETTPTLSQTDPAYKPKACGFIVLVVDLKIPISMMLLHLLIINILCTWCVHSQMILLPFMNV